MADVQHKSINTTDLHVFAYIASSDPGAVGAGIGWVDTSGGTGNFVLKVRNAGDTAWEDLGSSGGGSSTLAALTDVDLTGLADGDTLVWDATAGNWVPTAPGGSIDLDDLTDVVITSPSSGQVLKYNGTNWVNDTDATGGGGGSVGMFSVDIPYASPSTEDDEFNAGSLDGKWSVENVTPTIAFTIPNHIKFTGASSNISGIVQSVSSIDQTYRMKIAPPFDSSNNATPGFLLKHSGGYVEGIYLTGTRTLYIIVWTSTTSNTFTGYQTLFAGNDDVKPFYLECKYIASGNSYTFSFSLDGIQFKPFTTSAGLGNPISHIGISCRGGSGVSVFVDWFRKLQGQYTGGNY